MDPQSAPPCQGSLRLRSCTLGFPDSLFGTVEKSERVAALVDHLHGRTPPYSAHRLVHVLRNADLFPVTFLGHLSKLAEAFHVVLSTQVH